MQEKVFFISDSHFKYTASSELEQRKRRLFLDFLSELGGASRLYLVGDIFDFWFEYRHVRPRYYDDILQGLTSLQAKGTSIYLTGGNHDYWLGSYIRESLGFTVLPEMATHEIQGHRITITHGDHLLPHDYAYKMLKAFIRNRAVVATVQTLVHPDLLYAFASRFSRASKGITQKRTESAARTLISMAADSFFRWGNDCFVTGHIHYPLLERFQEKTFVILGDWEEHFSYLRLEQGSLFLERYRTGE